MFLYHIPHLHEGIDKPLNPFANINNILRNEKYIGDALLQKTYTVDFLTKKRVKNNGIVPQYYVEGLHEAIIPREVYENKFTVEFKSGVTVDVEG
jgi:hypothetical protein